MTRQDELRLSEFRADLLRTLGEIYSELCAVRRAVRPARLFGETPVEELMDLIAYVIAECGADQAAAVVQPRLGDDEAETAIPASRDL